MKDAPQTVDTVSPSPLPRITIRFCTQCKWLLRAAYYAQELLSTFSTSLGEVALQPATGGVFVVEITTTTTTTATDSDTDNTTPQRRILWDRKADGGFPETAELKRRVRDAIDPHRDLGHVDRAARRQHNTSSSSSSPATTTTGPAANPAQAIASPASDPAAPPANTTTTEASTSSAAGGGEIPRPRDLAAGSASVDRVVPAGARGVKPMIRPPPARLQEAAEARLAEARRRRGEDAGEGEGEGKKGGDKAACEDCE